jgi:hypothetical protein
MSAALRTISVLLLLFNGIGAFYGSFKFITDPSGASLGMDSFLTQAFSLHQLFNSRYRILLVANGILSFVVIAMVFLKAKFYPD